MTYEPRPGIVRATVVAGGVTTQYLCAGSGRPLLVLAHESRRGALMQAAPAGFRVLAPIMCEADRTIGADGLIELLDGLGLWKVDVVADAEFATLARASAQSSPDRFVSLLFVDAGTIDLTSVLASLAR